MTAVPLAYDDTGTGQPPLLLIHGLTSARTTWAGLVPELLDEHRVVAVDLRGHGESPHVPGTYTLDHYSADVIAFCDDVVREPALVVGHSLGGVVAAHLCQQRPDLVAGAVLEDPPLYFAERAGASREGVAALFPMMRDLFRGLRDAQAPLEQYEAVVRAAPALHGRGGTMADVLGPAGTVDQARCWAGLDPEVLTPAIEGGALDGLRLHEPLDPPVTVLRADPALGPAFTPDDELRFLAVNPHARVVAVDRASHAIHDEQPEVVIEAITALVGVLRGE